MATTTVLTAMAVLFLQGQQATPPQQQTTPPQDPATETFTDPALGLSFTHPSTWTKTTLAPTPADTSGGKKPVIPNPFKKKPNPKKPEEGSVVFTLPGANGSASSELTIVRASFSGAPETWQQIQADSNKNQKRNVERQWQQEILGVPLLLTRIGYTDKNGTATTTLTGLLYNAAPYKLLFRLTGPTETFDTAQFEFTKAMETLRTTNDSLPTTQEPGKEIAPPAAAPGPDAKHPLFIKPKTDYKKAPVALNVMAGDRKMILHVPEGWKLEKQEGDVMTLRHEGLNVPVIAKVFAVATAPRPTEALMSAANTTLTEFKTVDLREDTPGTPNKAGNPLLAIWRNGAGTAGPLAAMDAVLVAGDNYILFSSRPTAGTGLAAERKLIQALMDEAGLEPAP